MNQTDTLMARARHDADRRLIGFGDDPWLIEWFLTLSPGERLAYAERIATFALRQRREHDLT